MLLYVDVIDTCHLKCPTCVRGVRAFPNTATRMPLGKFREIVAKARSDGAYRVDLFSWSEPFLRQDLHEFISVVKEAGLPCGVSSTFSLPNIRHFDAAVCAMDVLTISISGLSQEIYEINHVGGRIEWVLRNLQRLAELKRSGAAHVDAVLRLLVFDYNRAQEAPLRELANSLGLRFEVLIAEGHPVTMPQPRDAGEYVVRQLHDFRASTPPANGMGAICPLIFEHVTVNAAGDVYQCSAHGNYDVLKIGPFLELTREEILMRRYTQPVCNSCSWGRRAATPTERELLRQALQARLGEAIGNRLPHLSAPDGHAPTTTDGHLIAKSMQNSSELLPVGMAWRQGSEAISSD